MSSFFFFFGIFLFAAPLLVRTSRPHIVSYFLYASIPLATYVLLLSRNIIRLSFLQKLASTFIEKFETVCASASFIQHLVFQLTNNRTCDIAVKLISMRAK